MKLLRVTTAALFLGAATAAAAQTRADAFADQLRQMELLQSVGTYTFKPTPTLGSNATDPVVRESFADNFAAMQAQSSNSDQWQPESDRNATYASAPADPVDRGRFGGTFALMQAASSNSDAWKLPAAEGAPAYATANETTIAREATAPTFVQRIARAFGARNGASAQ